MTADITTRERKARNYLKKLDCELKKTPPRHWTRAKHGVGYMITAGIITFAGHECEPDGIFREYALSLADVEAYIAGLAAEKIDEELRAVIRTYAAAGGDRFVEVAAAMVREAV